MDQQPNTLTIPQSGQLKIDIHLSAAINVTAAVARRKVNALLASQLGNLPLAAEPVLTVGERIVWRVPVDLTRPPDGRIGRVGDIDVDIETGAVTLNETQINGIRDHANRLTAGSPLK